MVEAKQRKPGVVSTTAPPLQLANGQVRSKHCRLALVWVLDQGDGEACAHPHPWTAPASKCSLVNTQAGPAVGCETTLLSPHYTSAYLLGECLLHGLQPDCETRRLFYK
jgi:hypothetical protein